MIRTPRRPGTTLMEVLIATGILAIGMLAILALFPIGAISMARAINQNRSADHAANSDTVFRFYWKNAWLDQSGGGGLRSLDRPNLLLPPGPNNVGARDVEPMITWLDHVPVDANGDGQPDRAIPATSAQPSFPVLVDPIGFRTQTILGPNFQNFIAGLPNLPIRTNLAATPTTTLDPFPLRATVRNTTMLDEFSYDGNGEPSALSGQIDRGGRYNVAWLMQRPKNNVPHEVHLQVLVFAGRSPTDTPATEQVFPAIANDYFPNIEPKPKMLTVAVNGQKPALLKGKWVAFTTPILPRGLPPLPVGVQYPAFDFYRIAAVEEVDVNTMTVELELPLRTYDVTTFVPGNYIPGTGTVIGNIVIFDTLFEVFDRGLVSAGAQAGR